MFDSFHDHPFARDLIQRKARQLVRRSEFRGEDEDDVVQDLRTHLWRSSGRFDSSRGSLPAFIKAVVERHAASLVRRQRAERRNPTGSASLDRPIPGRDGPIDLGSTLPEDQSRKHRGRSSRTAQEEAELRLDVEAARTALSDELRDLADRLTRDKPAQVARDRNVPRTSQHEEIRRLRGRFERKDLDEYF